MFFSETVKEWKEKQTFSALQPSADRIISIQNPNIGVLPWSVTWLV